MKTVFDVDPWSKPHIKKAFPDATFVDDRLSADNVAEYKDAEIVLNVSYLWIFHMR